MKPLSKSREAGKIVLVLASPLLLLVFIVIVIFGFLVWLYGAGLCGNEIVQEVYSPNGNYKGVVF